MIVYGHNSGAAEIGDAGTMECPVCKATTPATAMVFYKYFHIWWLCSLVTSRRYALMCSACETAIPTTVEDLELAGHAPRKAIPFLRRNGWLVTVLLIACVIGFGVVQNRIAAYQTSRIIADPKVGDLYLGMLTAIDGTGFNESTIEEIGGPGYGGMKLVAVDEDVRIFATTMMVWNTKKSLRKYMKSEDLAYDLDGLVLLSAEEVDTLHNTGILYEISRGEPLEFPAEDEAEDEEEAGEAEESPENTLT